MRRKQTIHPPELRALQKEIRNHPPLVKILKNHNEVRDFGDWLTAIYTYLGMLIDGYFTADDFPNMCNTLTKELYKRRSSLIIL